MIMRADVLARTIDPLLSPAFAHIRTIRIGTKALSFWPYRFLTDPDADDLLRLLDRAVGTGRHVSIMAHFNHPRELGTVAVREAIGRIRATGATIRTQSPLLHHINDASSTWADMWKQQVGLGMIPYYMFIARDTGAHRYFSVPLVRAWQVYSDAVRTVGGLARTARGPVMSAHPGKILLLGVTDPTPAGQTMLFTMLQGRDARWVNRPFQAHYDSAATWIDDLRWVAGHEPPFTSRTRHQRPVTTLHLHT